MSEYAKLQEEIKLAESTKDEAVRIAKYKLDEFIENQTFTGAELLAMRDHLRRKNDDLPGRDEPRVDYILERIMMNREG